jgi:hypothetical protein
MGLYGLDGFRWVRDSFVIYGESLCIVLFNSISERCSFGLSRNIFKEDSENDHLSTPLKYIFLVNTVAILRKLHYKIEEYYTFNPLPYG